MPTTVETLWAMWSNVMAAFGTLVAIGGGAAAIAYAFFRFFGEKWLNARFEERLADYKHVQQQELERLRLKINTLMDRTTKLHQREFDVIPEAWSLLIRANATVHSFISPVQQTPDVSRMTEEHLEEFLKNSDLQNWQKEQVRDALDKTECYRKAIYWHRRANVQNVCVEYNTFIRNNGIFMPTSIKDNFKKIGDMLWDAFGEHEDNEEYDFKPRDRDMRKKLDAEGPKLLDAIEAGVQERIWSAHVKDI
jgi:hypothetical protein